MHFTDATKSRKKNVQIKEKKFNLTSVNLSILLTFFQGEEVEGSDRRGSSGRWQKLWEEIGKLEEIMRVGVGEIRGVKVWKMGLRGN